MKNRAGGTTCFRKRDDPEKCYACDFARVDKILFCKTHETLINDEQRLALTHGEKQQFSLLWSDEIWAVDTEDMFVRKCVLAIIAEGGFAHGSDLANIVR